MATPTLERALKDQQERLLPCVHCGFCLPVCPTYRRLGDEADSPRGRLHLMGAVVEGRLDAGSDAFRTHIDRCLGCRACEPVCPSGVEYGTLLELARDAAARARPPGLLTRVLLMVMGSATLRALAFGPARLLRALGLDAVARALPERGMLGRARFGLAMLAASSPVRLERVGGPRAARHSSDPGDRSDASPGRAEASPEGAAGGGPAADGEASKNREPTGAEAAAGTRPRTVGVLTGCVQAGLYDHVNRATERTLTANGYEIVRVTGQGCCGALHAHGGSLERARALARRNIAAFEAAGVGAVAVNTAGCGAAMKDYDTLLEDDEAWVARAEALSKCVQDATELLAAAGPRRGAEIACRVAYDHPCHLLHGQGIRAQPLDVLTAIPGVEVHEVDDAEECCGGAGIYGITHPELGGEIGGDKVQAVRRVGADLACTPNPGCMMQIGAGLRLQGSREQVVHPVELLDESYRRAGFYGGVG